MAVPGAKLRFLYVGSSDVAKDLELYAGRLGGRIVWDHTAFDARVAAVEPAGGGPLVLLADHRPPGTALLVYEVPALRAAAIALKEAGFEPEGAPFEIPNGPCRLWKAPGGSELALFEDARPNALVDE